MRIEVAEESFDQLESYLTVRNAFRASTVLDARAQGGAWQLAERPVKDEFRKDYDAVEDPRTWPKLFDVSKWLVLAAYVDGSRAGGAIMAVDTPGVDMFEGRHDLAVLWDIRVDEPLRGKGVGAELVAQAEAAARRAGCSELKVETQNTNPAACRFYARCGFALTEVRPDAYPSLPGETQLIWRKPLR